MAGREITPRELQVVLANDTGVLAKYYRAMLVTIEQELLCIQDLLQQPTGFELSVMARVSKLLALIQALRPTTSATKSAPAASKLSGPST